MRSAAPSGVVGTVTLVSVTTSPENDAGARPDGPASTGGWVGRHLRLEDAGLFLWLVFVQPIALSGGGSDRIGGGATDPVQGLLDLVGLLGLAACIAGRNQPGVVSGLVRDGDLLYAVGPLTGAVALALEETVSKVGLGGDLGLLPVGSASHRSPLRLVGRS